MKRAATVVLGAVLFANGARADAVDDEAESHFAAAKQHAIAGKWAEACVELEKSSALRPRMVTTYRLAECYEHVGRLASAWRKYLAAAEAAKAAGEPDKQQEAIKYAAKLEPRVPRLTIVIKAPPKDVVVRRDDERVPEGELGLAVPVDPGEHRVEVSAPTFGPFSKTVTLSEGQSLTVDVPALVAATGEVVTDTPPASPETGKTKSSLATIGLITTGVGVATLGVGTYLMFSARRRYAEGDAHCPGGLCDREGLAASEDGRSKALTATWVLAAGGVLAATGVTLWLVAPSSRESAPVALTISPTGALLTGRF